MRTVIAVAVVAVVVVAVAIVVALAVAVAAAVAGRGVVDWVLAMSIDGSNRVVVAVIVSLLSGAESYGSD